MAHNSKWLTQDSFKNIVLLKMMQAYPNAITSYEAVTENGVGVLMLLQTSASSYDSKTYPDTSHVVLLSTSHPSATEALVRHIPQNSKLIFKLNAPHDQPVLALHFALQRVTSFISFTTANPISIFDATDIRINPTLDLQCLPLFAQQGYDEAEMRGYFAKNSAYCIALYRGAHPVAACFTYQNYADIWEIGGVYTLPSARQQGLGKRVVAAALQHLQQHKLTPRYQMHEKNIASMQLAYSLGLQPAVTITHWQN